MIKYLSSLSNFETSRLEYFVTHENANFSFEVFFRDPLRIIHSSSLKESALSFSIVWNKKCETLRKLSANCSNLPPSVEKWKSVFPRAEISSKKEECRGYEGRGGNQRLTAWHWLKFVFRQRIKIVPTLPSRRGRYSITHVNCRIKGKRERERERKRWRNIDSWMRMHPRDEFIPDVFVNGFERVWNLENLNRWKSSFLLPRIGTQRTKEFLIIAWKYLFFLIFLIFSLFSEKRISYSLNQMHFAKTFHFAKKEKKRMTV